MEIITERAEVDRCQAVLEKSFKRGTSTFTRVVQGANLSERCRIHWDPRNGVWAHFRLTNTRFWNPFGLDDPESPGHTKYVSNVVQINPSRLGNFNTGGAFVSDSEAAVVYLAHCGKIGGESVGQTENFISTFDTVRLKAGRTAKPYTIIADIEDPQLNRRIAAFVAAAASFKTGQGKMKASTKSAKPLSGEEYAGKIRYRRGGYVSTVRLHGRVYRYLKSALEKLGVSGLQRDVNRDLYLRKGGRYVLFEIKTGDSPYDVYTAVGQLLLHGDGAKSTSRVLVAPSVSSHFSDKLRALGISTITYRDDGKTIAFDGLDLIF